jgi:hypothetical protein
MKELSLGPMFSVTLMNRSDVDEEELNVGKGDCAIIKTKNPIITRARIPPATVILSSFNYLRFSF